MCTQAGHSLSLGKEKKITFFAPGRYGKNPYRCIIICICLRGFMDEVSSDPPQNLVHRDLSLPSPHISDGGTEAQGQRESK